MKKLLVVWEKAPALFLSLLFLIGVASAFYLPCALLIFLFPKRIFWLLPLAAFCYTKLLYPSLPKEEEGKALFHITEFKRHAGPIHTTFVYSGTLQMENLPKLPCRIYLPPKKAPYPASYDYVFEVGTLTEIGKGSYIYKPKSPWTPLPHTSSLAAWRFTQKEKVKTWIHTRFSHQKIATFYTALATGNLESRPLAFHFQKVGLSHLLAISGFHFALLSFFLAFLLKRFLPQRALACALILLLSIYFFYMGGSPSISRAWIGVVIYLIGLLFHLRPSPINTLGVALLLALALDPIILLNVGFQLSFAATLGILLFYRSFAKWGENLFPKRPYETLLQFPLSHQIGYLLCAYLRNALALQCAVLTFTLPLILFHFETFPLISLFYNLFVPLLLSILLALFLLHLDFLAAPLTHFLLSLIEHAPKKLLFTLNAKGALALASALFALYLLRNKNSLASFRKHVVDKR